MRAILRNYRQSPRKVRLLADLIRGKAASEALTLLAFTPKRASLQFKKVLESAIANASHTANISIEDLVVSKATVDQGVTLSRWIPKAMGSSAPINKKCCHITIELARPGAPKAAQSPRRGTIKKVDAKAKVAVAAAPKAEKKAAPKAAKKKTS